MADEGQSGPNGRRDDDHERQDGPSRAAREVVRATSDLAGIVASLLLALYADAELYRVESGEAGGLERLILDPAPPDASHLRRLLFELVDRPEWRVKHTITREVTDGDGERLEVLTPLPAAEYRGEARLVGPFVTREEADTWGADHAVSSLSYDTFAVGGAWLVDLFELPAGS